MRVLRVLFSLAPVLLGVQHMSFRWAFVTQVFQSGEDALAVQSALGAAGVGFAATPPCRGSGPHHLCLAGFFKTGLPNGGIFLLRDAFRRSVSRPTRAVRVAIADDDGLSGFDGSTVAILTWLPDGRVAGAWLQPMDEAAR
jgi:hypothetical protein